MIWPQMAIIFQVFLVLWWWLFAILIIGTCRFLFRLLEICCFGLRFWMLKMLMKDHFKQRPSIDQINVKIYIRNCSIGNWFVLYQMGKNMNKVMFVDFLVKLANTVDPIQGYWRVFAQPDYINRDKRNKGNENLAPQF